MTLTNGDLKKIKEVVDARAERTEEYVDRRFAESEAKMASKYDLEALEARLSAKIDKRTEMIQGDQFEVGRDLASLKKLTPRVRKLEKQVRIKP